MKFTSPSTAPAKDALEQLPFIQDYAAAYHQLETIRELKKTEEDAVAKLVAEEAALSSKIEDGQKSLLKLQEEVRSIQLQKKQEQDSSEEYRKREESRIGKMSQEAEAKSRELDEREKKIDEREKIVTRSEFQVQAATEEIAVMKADVVRRASLMDESEKALKDKEVAFANRVASVHSREENVEKREEEVEAAKEAADAVLKSAQSEAAKASEEKRAAERMTALAEESLKRVRQREEELKPFGQLQREFKDLVVQFLSVKDDEKAKAVVDYLTEKFPEA